MKVEDIDKQIIINYFKDNSNIVDIFIGDASIVDDHIVFFMKYRYETDKICYLYNTIYISSYKKQYQLSSREQKLKRILNGV